MSAAATTVVNRDDDDACSRLRDLNDYESMLATSTCNVGMHLSWTRQDACAALSVDSLLREVWARCVAQRKLLQVRLVPKEAPNDKGPLGQRYTLLPGHVEADDESNPLFVIHHDDKNESSASFSCDSLVRELQKIGTTALDIDTGSYFVSCRVQKQQQEPGGDTAGSSGNTTTATGRGTTINVQVILSLCHALSDGPGALQVARSFLEHLSDVLAAEQRGSMMKSQKELQQEAQPLTDLQALLLGSDHGAQEQPANPHAFEGQDDFVKLLSESDNGKKTIVLPPESMQGIPCDDTSRIPQSTVIDCVHFSLSVKETNALRIACRNRGTTVQGALTAAALHARVALLGLVDKKQDGRETMLHAAVQIPVNMRRFADDSKRKVPVKDEDCLCGSAGVWHPVKVLLLDKNEDNSSDQLWLMAKHSTASVRAALEDDAEQPREWLRRLFHDPATLPPYSLMVSSLGVAPIEESYGKQQREEQQQQSCCLKVSRVLFFGGALTNSAPPPPDQPPPQSTMIHAMTFGGEFNGMFNYTSPGVSKEFAIKTAKLIKTTLLSLTTGGG